MPPTSNPRKAQTPANNTLERNLQSSTSLQLADALQIPLNCATLAPKLKRLHPIIRVLLWIAGVIGFLFIAAIALIAFIAARIPSKESAPHAPSNPILNELSAAPILQLEDHTCGFLSLSAAYSKYGLSPEAENLRYRLGVDRPANPLDGSTTGTLHPDIFRVLIQDNFEYQLLDPALPNTITALHNHLEAGHAALILISRRENGNLHWAMTDGLEGSNLRIVDSLHESPYPEVPIDFIDNFVLSIIAMRPAPTSLSTKLEPYTDGIDELEKVRKRIASRQTKG